MNLRRLTALLLCATACYRYTPIEAGSAPTGSPVRVRLTEQGSIDLAPMIGPTILTLDGTIAVARDTSLTLAVTNAIARSGIETTWTGEPVEIPRTAIVSVQLRELDKRRSWLTAVAGVGGTIALGVTWNLLGGTFGGKQGPSNGGPR